MTTEPTIAYPRGLCYYSLLSSLLIGPEWLERCKYR